MYRVLPELEEEITWFEKMMDEQKGTPEFKKEMKRLENERYYETAVDIVWPPIKEKETNIPLCPKCGSKKTVIYPTCSDRIYCAKCGRQKVKELERKRGEGGRDDKERSHKKDI